MNASLVTETLAVGGADAAAAMRRRGFALVCVADNLPAPPDGHHFPMADGSGSDANLMAMGLRHVARRLAEGRPVYVYCRHGMNRSVCVAAAALKLSGRCRWVSEGVALVKAARAVAAPRDDTLAEVLAVVMRLAPPGPNHE